MLSIDLLFFFFSFFFSPDFDPVPKNNLKVLTSIDQTLTSTSRLKTFRNCENENYSKKEIYERYFFGTFSNVGEVTSHPFTTAANSAWKNKKKFSQFRIYNTTKLGFTSIPSN